MKNIFLVGMPSSGKTTVGKRLAELLHYRFIDTDKLIVRQEGRSVAHIFDQFGEEYFRRAEARVLRTIQPGGSAVIATGGGLPCLNDNMVYINATGISVFLDVPVENLVRRMIAHGQDDRPLYKPSDPELLASLQQRYAARLPFYSAANITVSGEASVNEVLQRVGEWL